jgi:IS30 family transposase
MGNNIFEEIKRINEYQSEYWSARDLAKVLGNRKGTEKGEQKRGQGTEKGSEQKRGQRTEKGSSTFFTNQKYDILVLWLEYQGI